MPVTYFDVRWPDGATERCYSPSSIVTEHLQVRSYTVAEFRAAAGVALHGAAERVREKFGFTCSSALDQLRTLEKRADAFDPCAELWVLGFASAGDE